MNRNRLRPTGFNFAEVLFAVMILGIGFIMVAALFPVALQQTKTSGEEVVAATVARGGVNYFQQAGLTAGALYSTDMLLEIDKTTPYQPTHSQGPITTNTAPAIPPVVLANSSRRIPGKVVSFRDNRFNSEAAPFDLRDRLWRQVSGNLILPDAPSTAWVGMYARGATYKNDTNGAVAINSTNIGNNSLTVTLDPYATIIVVGVQARARSQYDLGTPAVPGKDLRRYPVDNFASTMPGTLEPTEVYVKLTEGDTNPDTVTFCTAAGAQMDAQIAAEGAYIVISDDQLTDINNTTPSLLDNNGRLNGHIYRLGVKRDDLGVGVWELSPDGDMTFINPDNVPNTADDINENIPARATTPLNVNPGGAPAIALMVGRGYADPTAPLNGYEGTAQDTGVYIGIVPAN